MTDRTLDEKTYDIACKYTQIYLDRKRNGTPLRVDELIHDAIREALALRDAGDAVACPFGCTTQEEHDAHFHTAPISLHAATVERCAKVCRDEANKTNSSIERACLMELERRIRQLAPETGMVSVPREPSEGLLMSMAIRYDHALGCPGYYDQPMFAAQGVTHAQRLESTLRTMRQLYEEISGRGFYSSEREDDYKALLAAASGEKE